MRISRLSLLLLLLLAACATTPAVPTPVAERPTAQSESAPTATLSEEATEVPPPTIVSTPTEAPTDVPSPEPEATLSSQPPEIASGDIGTLQPVTYTVPVELRPVPSGTFATFSPQPTSVEPRGSAPSIASDLSNVAVPFALSAEQRALLGRQGFVISPGDTKEFYELYERARYNYEPVFVTSDSLLHVYHLLFDRTLRVAEQERFIPMLAALDWALLETSVKQYEALTGTHWQEAARRNAAYFAVAVKLLNPNWQVPEGLQDLVDPDLASIMAHEGIGPSVIFPGYPFGEDWSQYVPRGHYTRSEALEQYFRAMMWHGRMTLRQVDPIETRQAALMTQAWLHTDVESLPAATVWESIYEPTVFFVGRSDDLTPTEYQGPFTDVYGTTSEPSALLDEAKFGQFEARIAELRPPEVLGMVIAEDMPVDETTKGLRFMGQRFVPDSFVFGQLIHRNVPERYLPKGLDLFAAMGSERALEHLAASGDATMPGYSEQMAKVRELVSGYDEETWTQNLYWSWLYTLRPMLEPAPDGYPQFMRSPAWLDKQLNTVLGSWTELRHDTILYAKQVYAEMGAGDLPPPTPEPPKGYVEPVPEVYARIAAIAQMTIGGLKERGLLLEIDEQALTEMVTIATRLQTIAEKELRGEALTDEEYEKIRFYGGDLERLTFGAGLDPQDPFGGSPAAAAPEAAIVADVATNPAGGVVLEEAIGRVFPIYVVVPVEGQLTVAIGGVFSHYEFEQPLADRLTNETWRAMLETGDVPPMEPWKSALIVEETPAAELATTIRGFNDKLAEALWFTDIEYVREFLVEPELADTENYLQGLRDRGEFVGLKRLSLEYLSFDLRDESHATVTTRERFSEELRQGSPVGTSTPPPVVGVRPEYETTVAYTMIKEDDVWKISRIVVDNPPGDWQQP